MEVIPIPLENQYKPIPNIRTRTFFILNDHLDERVLKNALDRLIRDHWRKLGARLATRRQDGLLEYHLPSTFDDSYELFRWSSRDDARSISEVASYLQGPPSEEGVTLFPPLSSFEDQLRPLDWPFELKDDPPNSPILYIHLTLFSDATVVAISCAHAAMDQFGVANVIKAWMGVVEGKAPPPMVGYSESMLAHIKPYAEYSKEDVSRKGQMRIRRFGEYFLVLLGLAPEYIRRPKEEAFTVFFPLSVVESLRKRHTKILEEKHGAPPGLSNGDIINAALLKLSRIHDKPRIITMQQAMNLRNRIPTLSGPNAEAYVHNALNLISTRFPVNSSTPLSELAYYNRKCINQSIDEKEIERNMAISVEAVRRGQNCHVCEPFERSFSVTNWSSAWRDVDFSPASKFAADKEAEKPKMMVLGHSLEKYVGFRLCSVVMCKTRNGYWATFGAPRARAKLIREYLAKDPKLENL